jgi:PIN domain nuclease of toxin-antitoxin system
VTSYLLDTHTWCWSFLRTFVRQKTADILLSADALSVSSISFYEVRQKVRIGKWPEMAPYVADLGEILTRQGADAIAITTAIADLAGALEWDHRDPFDRMIAATSITLKLPLISADEAFDQLSARKDWPGRVW